MDKTAAESNVSNGEKIFVKYLIHFNHSKLISYPFFV